MARMRKVVTAAAIMFAGPAIAQTQWTELGQREVSDRVERDTIRTSGPGRWQAQYSQIALCTERAPVRFHDVTVHFRNGRSQNVAVQSLVRAGACSDRYDLRGRDRDIAAVDFTYEAASLGRRTGRVRLFAR
jgi:hypothetical protein